MNHILAVLGRLSQRSGHCQGLLPPRGSCTSGGVIFDPAHLWFLYVLVLFSIMLLPVFGNLRRPQGNLIVDQMARLADRHASAAVRRSPDGSGGGGIRPGHQYRRLRTVGLWLSLLYGYLIASDRRFEAALRRALLSAVAAGGARHDGGNGNGGDEFVDDLLHLGAERRLVGGLLDPGFGVAAAGAIGGDPL
jgi:hypothetical protein